MIANNAASLLKPIQRRAIQYLPLEWNRAQQAIEAALPVCRHQQQAAIARLIGVAHLARILRLQRQIGRRQAFWNRIEQHLSIHLNSPR